MRPTELQIGDWVLWFNKPCKVDLPLLNTEFSDRKESDDIQPIRITAEILEKNGFKFFHSDCEMWVLATGGDWSIEVGLWGDMGTLIRCFKQEKGGSKSVHLSYTPYLHQLQQAIRLCGIDKKIEI